jgi:hypothetical protein
MCAAALARATRGQVGWRGEQRGHHRAAARGGLPPTAPLTLAPRMSGGRSRQGCWGAGQRCWDGGCYAATQMIHESIDEVIVLNFKLLWRVLVEKL